MSWCLETRFVCLRFFSLCCAPIGIPFASNIVLVNLFVSVCLCTALPPVSGIDEESVCATDLSLRPCL